MECYCSGIKLGAQGSVEYPEKGVLGEQETAHVTGVEKANMQMLNE